MIEAAPNRSMSRLSLVNKPENAVYTRAVPEIADKQINTIIVRLNSFRGNAPDCILRMGPSLSLLSVPFAGHPIHWPGWKEFAGRELL